MTAFLKKVIILLLCLVLLCACTPSKEKAVKDTTNAITSMFKEKPIEANEKTKHFSYYKPAAFKISQNGEQNIIFQDREDNVFILFVNPNENSKSQLNYQTIMNEKHKRDLLKSFHVGDHFIFVYVKPIKDKDYELVVGAGGVKMSTKTTLYHLEDEAKMMAKIIRSVHVNRN